MENTENNNKYERYADNIKTINEFLIDLIGVLVPGGIFLFSIIVSIIIPVIMIYFREINLKVATESVILDANLYATKWDLLASNIFHGWFWLVLFFVFLILSYAIGNIFYRLDIKDVDKLSFKRQRKKLFEDKIKPVIEQKRHYFKKIKERNLKNFLEEYFELLFYHLKENGKYSNMDKQRWMEIFEKIKDDVKVISILNEIAFLLYEKKLQDVLILLKEKLDDNSISDAQTQTERQSTKNGNEGANVENILGKTNNSSIIIKEFLNPFVKSEIEGNPEFLAIGWYFLFCLRSEVACDNEYDCQFPYEHYDTYLLKRGELNLVKHAVWCKDKNSRTKNAINTFKLKIQLKSKEAYNILVKNEAHIRMASSSYRVANMARKIALVAIPVSFVLLFPFGKEFSLELIKYAIVIFSMPVSIFILNIFIKNSVVEFLHYQRLREIFFVIQVFDELVRYRIIRNEKEK